MKYMIGIILAVTALCTVMFYMHYGPDIESIDRVLVIGESQDEIYRHIKGKIDREPLISYPPGCVPVHRTWTVGVFDKSKFVYYIITAEFDRYIGDEKAQLKSKRIKKFYKLNDEYGGLFWAKIWG